MKINLKGKNIELTEILKDYVLKRVTDLEKLLANIENDGGEVLVYFEIGKSTKHHKSGDVFHSDCLIKINGKKFYAESNKEDLHQAIDEIKERLFSEVSKYKGKEQTLLRRGALSVKKMFKGISGRNPFTSKY